MSYQKITTKDNTKYVYSTKTKNDTLILFNIIFKNEKTSKKIKKVKNNKIGMLIENNDEILVDYDNFYVELLVLENGSEVIEMDLDVCLDNLEYFGSVTVNNNNIYLEIKQVDYKINVYYRIK